MKNIPRIFMGDDVAPNTTVAAMPDVAHYLGRVMRTDTFLAFGGGREFNARLAAPDGRQIIIGDQTSHVDPSGNVTLCFAPIKRTDDLINMATQMGVGVLQPVITDYTTAAHINWDRMRKIAVEAAEQSGRNSVPQILAPVRFRNLDLTGIAFADERASRDNRGVFYADRTKILVGPGGGFSTAEFAALDGAAAVSVNLGRTILRAELAAAIAIDRITKRN